MKLWEADVVYVDGWGFDHPGVACRPRVVAIDHSRFHVFPQPIDTAQYLWEPFAYWSQEYVRIVICAPDGTFLRRNIRVVRPWVQRPASPPNPDSTLRVDQRVCRLFS